MNILTYLLKSVDVWLYLDAGAGVNYDAARTGELVDIEVFPAN